MHEEKTAIAVERIPWGKSPSWLNTTLLLSWEIGIGGCGILLVGALVRIVAFISTVITSHLRLVLCCYGHSIASSPRGNVGVGGSIVVVELGWGTIEIASVSGVVVISSGPRVSTVGIGRTVHRGSVGSQGKSWRWVGAVLWGLMGSWLMHHATLAVLIGLVDLSFHLDGRVGASISAKRILTNTVCISSCRPFKNLSFFLAPVSISSGAYLANDKNLSPYSTTVILPCFSSLNSSLILLIKPGGTWVLLNLTLYSSQVII